MRHMQDTPRTQSLFHRLMEATGVSLAHCDQCGTCTDCCSLAGLMDLPPCRLVRLAQHGFEGFDRRVLESEAIWQCLDCGVCRSKCPQDLDLPRVMAFLREESLRLGLARANFEPSDSRDAERPVTGTVVQEARLGEGIRLEHRVES